MQKDAIVLKGEKKFQESTQEGPGKYRENTGNVLRKYIKEILHMGDTKSVCR